MSDIVIRRAMQEDMNRIIEMEIEVFTDEHGIPAALQGISDEKSPIWWCATLDENIIGAAAAWKENGQLHWGRFIVQKEFRGQQLGRKLAKHSFDDLFSSEIDEIYMEARETTVKIVSNIGGHILGDPVPFFEGTVTPMILKRSDYNSDFY